MAGSNHPSISSWPRTSGVAKTSGKVFKSHRQCLDSIHGHLPTTSSKVATMRQDMDQDYWSKQCRGQMLQSILLISTFCVWFCYISWHWLVIKQNKTNNLVEPLHPDCPVQRLLPQVVVELPPLAQVLPLPLGAEAAAAEGDLVFKFWIWMGLKNILWIS